MKLHSMVLHCMVQGRSGKEQECSKRKIPASKKPRSNRTENGVGGAAVQLNSKQLNIKDMFMNKNSKERQGRNGGNWNEAPDKEGG